MNLRFLIRPAAQVDVEAAALWYDEQRPGLGNDFFEKVTELFHQISESPLRFPIAGASVRRGFLDRFPYAVYFTLDEREIVIIAVLHQRRDPEVWKSRG
jgi:plasmid stabilization system protein ParE